MFGANAFGWIYCGQAYAGATTVEPPTPAVPAQGTEPDLAAGWAPRAHVIDGHAHLRAAAPTLLASGTVWHAPAVVTDAGFPALEAWVETQQALAVDDEECLLVL